MAPGRTPAVLDALRAPGLVHLVGDVGLEPQRENLHLKRLAIARGSCAADVDAALLGLADLPDEVTAVVAAVERPTTSRYFAQLLDRHRREPTARPRRRALGERRLASAGADVARAGARRRCGSSAGAGSTAGAANASSMRRTRNFLFGSRWSPRRLLEALPHSAPAARGCEAPWWPSSSRSWSSCS